MVVLFKQHRYHSNVFDWFRAFKEIGYEPELLVYKEDLTRIEGLNKAVYLKQSVLSKWIVKRYKRTRGDGVDQFTPYYFPRITSLYSHLRTKNPQLVILRPVFTFYSCQLILLSFLFGYKVVFYSQIRICKEVSNNKKRLLNFILWINKTVWISPCPGDKEIHLPISKRMHLFPFVKKDVLECRTKYFEKDRVNILVVAKIFPAKNLELAIEVFLSLRGRFEDVHLTICSGGSVHEPYFEKLIKMVDSSEYKSDIEFLRDLPHNEMRDTYLRHDILLLTSNYDQAALVPLESMGYGLVTLASLGNGTSNYISNGVDGYTFEKGNGSELAEKMENLIMNRENIVRMGNKAIETVKRNHDPEEVVGNLVKRLGLNLKESRI